jgi:type IV pilus assembly protein PilY1
MTQKTCSGQGIYFLTDGEPNPGGGTTTGADGKSGTAYELMSKTLDDKAVF